MSRDMNKTVYVVRMYYGSDLRYEAKILASGSVQALAVALHELSTRQGVQEEWVTGPEFKVVVQLEA